MVNRELAAKKINDLVEVGTAGHQYVGVRTVTDAERSPKAVMTGKECFAHSSNVGMAKLAYKAFAANPEKFKKYLHQFHLDKRSLKVDFESDFDHLPVKFVIQKQTKNKKKRYLKESE